MRREVAYCKKCGSRLVPGQTDLKEHDSKTGEPVFAAQWFYCPASLLGKLSPIWAYYFSGHSAAQFCIHDDGSSGFWYYESSADEAF